MGTIIIIFAAIFGNVGMYALAKFAQEKKLCAPFAIGYTVYSVIIVVLYITVQVLIR